MQQQAREIQKVKSTQNLTYAEAARKVKHVAETRMQSEQAQASQTMVNGTAQVERRSDKIKIVVECANRFLNCI
ncbi:hypothetical protein M9458_053568, partial [Cirrhinus mrigala]